MKNTIFKKAIPHIVALLLFIIFAAVYFYPVLEGKEILAMDSSTSLGMSKEIWDYRIETGEEPLWTNGIFGGMPAYLVSTKYPNALNTVDDIIRFLSHPISQLFAYLFCAYIALLLFGINPWLALLGSIAFGFTSYNFIIIEVGHNTKAMAIAYMVPVIAGVYHAYKKNLLRGVAITGLFLGLQLTTNHFQITYYTFLIILIFAIYEFVYMLREKYYKDFLKASFALLFIAIVAFGSSFGRLYTTYEYGKYSIRGKSDLTNNLDNKTSGLDKDYATMWSYGRFETMTLLIPNFHGGPGPTASELSTKSETYKVLSQIQGPANARNSIKSMHTYWGDQISVAPVYFGAIVIFLFVLSLYILKGRLKWWLLTATILSILLAWGRNFMWLTELFLDYFPGYNKFRAVSMTLVIAQFTIPLMGIFTLKEIFDRKIEKPQLLKYLKNAFYITGGVTLFFALLPGLFFDFESFRDQQYLAQGATEFIDALIADRKILLRNDAFRSFVFISLGALTIRLFVKDKLNTKYAIASLALLILVDLWAVDKRYLNDESFVSKRQAREPFQMTQADQQILQDQDPNYRVLNLTVDVFNEAHTSYFHKSIGGYHGAKMKRYQELIEHQISKSNMEVFNMLNTKYFIVQDNNYQPVPRRNYEALGNAWFVDNYKIVENADEEIAALSDFRAGDEAIIDKRFESFVDGKQFQHDSTSSIVLTSYEPNRLIYKSIASTEQLAVFSEIYYPKGWIVTVDGNEVDHFRVNYVLRSMVVPAGEHTIEFYFRPKSYFVGNKITLASSWLLIILVLGVFGFELFQYFKKEEVN